MVILAYVFASVSKVPVYVNALFWGTKKWQKYEDSVHALHRRVKWSANNTYVQYTRIHAISGGMTALPLSNQSLRHIAGVVGGAKREAPLQVWGDRVAVPAVEAVPKRVARWHAEVSSSHITIAVAAA